MNLKEMILSASDKPTEKVHVDEWGCDVWLTTWSGKERLSVADMPKDGDFLARVVALSLADEQGNVLFPGADDVKALNGRSGAVLERLALRALRHNGIGKEQEAKNL